MVERVKGPIAACLACAAGLVVLVVLAYAVGPAETLDAKLLVHLAAEEASGVWRLAGDVARLADPLPLLVMLGAVVLLALAAGRRREALAAVAVVLGANVTTQLLKGFLEHPRTQVWGEAAYVWSDAFPSGHATAAASIGAALVIVATPRWRPLAALAGAGFALAVGAAVVVLQWHFASDVLGAYLVVAGWGFAALAALRLGGPGWGQAPRGLGRAPALKSPRG